jgi:hypothetical protein
VRELIVERLAGPALVAVALFVCGTARAQAPDGGVAPPPDDTSAMGMAAPPDETQPTHTEPHVAPYRAAPAGEVREDDFTHKGQFSLRLGFGGTAYFAIKTARGPRCNDHDDTFCRGLGVALVDAEMAYGPTDGMEITTLIQVGFANDPLAQTLPIIVGLGLRLYPSPHDRVKPFFGFRAVLKYLDMKVGVLGDEISSWDGGIRAEGGLQVEITRAVGVYAQVAISIFFVNDFTMPFDFTGGAQVRFP